MLEEYALPDCWPASSRCVIKPLRGESLHGAGSTRPAVPGVSGLDFWHPDLPEVYPNKGDKQMHHTLGQEYLEYEALRMDIEAADAASVCRAQGPDLPVPFWHPCLPEVLVYRREPQAGGHICAKVRESAPYFRPLLNLSFALLILTLAIPATAQEPCKVNLTSGTVAELALLPGVGTVTAHAIAEAKPADEAALDAVKGIGPAKLAAIRPHAAYGTAKTNCTEKQKAPKKDGAQ